MRAAITVSGAFDDAREALKEAEKNDAAAFQAAVNNGGWTEDALHKIGLATPEKVQRVNRRKAVPTTAHAAFRAGGEGRSVGVTSDRQTVGAVLLLAIVVLQIAAVVLALQGHVMPRRSVIPRIVPLLILVCEAR